MISCSGYAAFKAFGFQLYEYVLERAEFLFVQHQTNMTPGNLSSHVGKLEEVGYLAVQKKFVPTPIGSR